jgi:fimbrial isopeptide formation D2 family protein/LPXTG-motif cell wall-anchored protein
MKKIFQPLSALALTFVMLLALAVPAFAAGDEKYTITITGDAVNHTYEAYQVFTGDLFEGVLSNIKWGGGVNGEALLTALKGDETLGSKFITAETAADVAEAMDGITSDSDDAQAFAAVVGKHLTSAAGSSNEEEGPYHIQNLDAGYYLVKDQEDSQNGENGVYTRFMLQVVTDVSAAPKSDLPTVTKKVKGDTDTSNEDNYSDVADFNIGGDNIPFLLTGTLPSYLADYDKYSYTFTDTLSSGLTYNGDAKVYVDGVEVSPPQVDIDGTDHKLTVKFDDLKVVPGVTKDSKITVKYTAKLNAAAVVGGAGNSNAVTLTYSNNPNAGGENDKGTTPPDTVLVFTYKLDVTKVDGTDKTTTLVNAEFVLFRGSEAIPEYAIVKDGKIDSWTNDEEEATTLISDSSGKFDVAGLDGGVYFLKETKAPAGYNLLDAVVKLEVIATMSDGSGTASLSALEIKVGDSGANTPGDIDTGTVSLIIENNKGATLPSTGGVGTTIFYAVGGVLMLGAVVLLITKKRIGGK